MSQFSDWLEHAMLDHGGRKYRQANLARDIHKRPNTIGDWLNGKAKPDEGDIVKLARLFKVRSRFIYGVLEIDPPEDLNDAREEADVLIDHLPNNGISKLVRDLKEGKYAK